MVLNSFVKDSSCIKLIPNGLVSYLSKVDIIYNQFDYPVYLDCRKPWKGLHKYDVTFSKYFGQNTRTTQIRVNTRAGLHLTTFIAVYSIQINVSFINDKADVYQYLINVFRSDHEELI